MERICSKIGDNLLGGVISISLAFPPCQSVHSLQSLRASCEAVFATLCRSCYNPQLAMITTL